MTPPLAPFYFHYMLHYLLLLLLSHSVVSDSVRPHRQQPTRLLCPWDSPDKNTGVGCHFLLPTLSRELLILNLEDSNFKVHKYSTRYMGFRAILTTIQIHTFCHYMTLDKSKCLPFSSIIYKMGMTLSAS